MPDISLIITLAIAVVSAIVIFKVAKGVIQGVLLASAVVSILTAVAGGLVVKDVLELKEKFQTSSNMVLLSDDAMSKLSAGTVIIGKIKDQETQESQEAQKTKATGEGGGTGNVKVLSATELNKLNSHFAAKDYAGMLGSNYKLIIAKESLTDDTLDDGGAADEEKSFAAIAEVINKINQDPLFLVSEYKKGNVIVYPQTPVFKVIKLIPLMLFKKVAEKVFHQAAGMTGEVASKASVAAAAVV